jgi:uncharacterized protein YuzE
MSLARPKEGSMETILKPRTVQAVTQAVPLLLKLPLERFWVDYDKEADVLYISLRRPQKATDTRATDEGILLRYQGRELVGITVLEASTRGLQAPAATEEPQPSTATAKKRRRSSKKTS